MIKTLLKGEGKCQIAIDEDEDDEVYILSLIGKRNRYKSLGIFD